MPSALTWSVESVLLGLWALVFSSYSTPLHDFVARSHVLVSTSTVVLHLTVVSRGYVVGMAVSQAFLCAVSALFLTYLLAVFADRDSVDDRLFRMPRVGLLKLDAVIGLAWFAAALLSGIGMVLSCISNAPGLNSGKTLLMLHPLGSHVMILFPCLAALKIAMGGAPLSFAFMCVWCVYLVDTWVFVLLGTDLSSLLLNRSSKWYTRVLANTLYSFRFSMVAIPLCVLISVSMHGSQVAVIIFLTVVAIMPLLDTLAALVYNGLRWVLGRGYYFPSYDLMISGLLRRVDVYFGARQSEGSYLPSAPPEDYLPSAPPATAVVAQSASLASDTKLYHTTSNFRIPRSMEPPPLSLPRHRASPVDPAAVQF